MGHIRYPEQPQKPVSIPRFHERYFEEWFTCSKCQVIFDLCPKKLDGKIICSSCLDDLIHAPAKRVCAERDYHETNGRSFSGQYRDDGDSRIFSLTLYCRCGISAPFNSVIKLISATDRRCLPEKAAPRAWKIMNGSAIEFCPPTDAIDAM